VFLLQCAARGSQRLALTELELATAAFALLNVITYAMWWDKPLDVQCPIRVRRTRAREERDVDGGTGDSSEAAVNGTRSWIWSEVLKPFDSMIGGVGDDTFFVLGERDKDVGKAWIFTAILLTMVFGGIHCIGWRFHFPSHAEQLLWRISSVAITAVPLAFTCTAPFVYGITYNIELPAAGPLVLLYFFSRVVLLVLCLTTLRSLPSSVLQTVVLTTFLPHV
jgi:hypothetical protein